MVTGDRELGGAAREMKYDQLSREDLLRLLTERDDENVGGIRLT